MFTTHRQQTWRTCREPNVLYTDQTVEHFVANEATYFQLWSTEISDMRAEANFQKTRQAKTLLVAFEAASVQHVARTARRRARRPVGVHEDVEWLGRAHVRLPAVQKSVVRQCYEDDRR